MCWETEGPHIVLNVLEAPVYPILIDPLATIPGKALLPFKLPENLLSFLGPGAKVVDVTCSSTIANFAEDSGSDEEPIPKKQTKEHSAAHRKIGLPSFSKLFPSFRLPTQWLRSLYGGSKPEATALAKGQKALLRHASLPHFDIGLDWDGNIKYDAKSWSLTVSPPGLALGAVELLNGPNLHVLRGEHAETGISFYKDSARHFFLLSKPLQSKFALKFSLNGGAKIEFDSEHHYLTISEGGQPRLVYSAPLLRLPSGQTSAQRIAWDGTSFSVDLPSTPESFPLVLAFSIVGKKPTGPKSLASLFPSLKIGEKGDVHDSAESSSSSSSSEDELDSGKGKRKRHVTKSDSSSDDEESEEQTRRRKIALPSFSVKFPNFRLGKAWTTSLYGDAGDDAQPEEYSKEHHAVHSHPALQNVPAALRWDGQVEYGSEENGWKIKIIPTTFPISTSSDRQLILRHGLQLLRSTDYECGLSYDKSSSRHFFIFGKSPSSTRFALQFESLAGSSDVEVHSDQGIISFLDQSGKHRLSYAKPLVRIGSSPYTSLAEFEWDDKTRSIVVTLPAAEAPVLLMFGLYTTAPSAGAPSAYPSLITSIIRPLKKLIGAIGTTKSEKASRKLEIDLPSFSAKIPHLKSWTGSLYGKASGLAPVKSGQPATLQHASLNNTRVDLSLKGEIEYHTPGWKIKFTPNFDLTTPALLQGKGLQLVRGEDGETGLSYDKHFTRHFFMYSKAPTHPKLLLQLEQLEGSTALEYEPDKGFIAFKDQDGNLLLVYSSPVAILPSGEAISIAAEWDGESSGIAIQLPQVSPLVIIFGVTAQIPDDSLAFLGQKVRRSASGKLKTSDQDDSEEDEDDEYKDKIGYSKKVQPEHKKVAESKSVKDIGFPKFADLSSLGDDWKSLYGDPSGATVELFDGQAPLRSHGHLNVAVGLQHNGDVEFGSPDWKVTLSPSFKLTNPKLYQRERVQLLRGEDGETGVSVDKRNSSRHFFLFGKTPADFRLLLRLEQITGSTSLEFNPAIGYITISDPQDTNILIVYRSPVALIPGREPIPLTIEWDGEESAIAVNIPEDVPAPFLVTFTVDNKVPEEEEEPTIVEREQQHQTQGQKPSKSVGKIDISPPSFAGKFPNFKLSKSWLPILYGHSGANLAPVAGGHPTLESHPSLNGLEVALAENGEVEFGNSSYRVKLSVNFDVPSPKLYRRDGLQLLRGDDVETGLSFDKDTTRHFFFFGKAAPSKLLLNLEQLIGSTKLEFNPEAGYVAFSDQNDKVILVYSSPVVRLPSNETVTLPIEWDGENSAISVKLPEGSPLIVAFGVAAKLPKSKRDFLALLFPWLKFGASGTVEDGEDDKGKTTEKKKTPAFTFPSKSTSPAPKSSGSPGATGDRSSQAKQITGLKVGVPSFTLKWPTFDLGRTWISNLYGTAEDPLKPTTEPLARHVHPFLNKLDVGLSPSGTAEFNAPDWKAKFTPNFEIANPKLWIGNGVHIARGDDGEVGLSFDKLSSRHYFFFGQQPPEKFLLTFASVEGTSRVELNKEKASVAFFDAAGRVRLVYSAPTAKLSNNQTITLGIDWDASASAIVITLPEQSSPPLVLALALGLKYTELKGDSKQRLAGRTLTPTPSDSDKGKEETASKGSPHERKASFSGVKFHTFKLDRSWLGDLYGGSDVALTPIPGKFPKQAHPFLPNIDVTLGPDGAVEYGAGDWKFKLTPAFVPTPPVPHRGDGVFVLRGEDGETGLYFDKVASRHFFVIGRALPTTKFGMKLTQVNGSTKIEFSREKGFVAFSDSTGKYRLVYSSPRVQTGSGKIASPSIDWDNASNTLSINVVDLNTPIIIAFHLGVKVTLGPKFRQARPGSGTYEPIDVDEEGKSKSKPSSVSGTGFTGFPSFLTKFPSFRIAKPWQDALYGPTEVTLTPIPSVSRQPIPALNGLDVGLSAGGDVDFGSSDWKIKLAPVNFSLTGAKLHKGEGLQVVRGDASEVGISFDQHSLRHYFFFGRAPATQKFSIKLTPLSGSVKAELNKEKGVVTFSDHAGKLKFVYIAPVILLASGKTVPVNIDWEGPSNSLFVLLPDMSYPMVLAFGVTGKLPESRDTARNISFPSFRFGASGNIEVPREEEKETTKEVPKTKRTTTTASASDKAKQLGFSFNLPKASRPKASLPSFSLHFPKFRIGGSWSTTLYGRSGHTLSPVPEGQPLRSSNAALPHFEVGLSPEGEVHFSSADWKLSVAPVSFKLTAPKLFKADGLQLLRGDDGEIGVSFDETSSRHFFFLGKAPSGTKFSIKLTQSGAKADFNKERGYLALVKGSVTLVYYAPVVLLPNNKTVTLPLDWDAQATTLSIVLPDLTFPVIIAFGLGTKIPDGKHKFGFSFPSLKFGSSGDVESDDDEDDEQTRKYSKPAPKPSFPVSYQKGVPSPQIADTLYGTSTAPLSDVPSGQSAQFKHPALGLEIGLNSSGELEFASPTFKVKLSPNVKLTSPKLLKRDGLQLLRADDGETGVSFGNEGPSRHFFILGKAPTGGKLSLTLAALAGGVKLKFDKHSIEVGDKDGKTQFVYLSPIGQYGGKTVTFPLEWDPATSSIFVTIPSSATYPLLVAFGVSPKVLEGNARWSVSFPSLRGRIAKTGEVDEGPEESHESRKKLVLPSFFGTFSPTKLLKWLATLYGPNIKADALVEPPEGETSLHASIPSLGLSVSLNEDGEVEFGSPVWKGKFFPEGTIRFSKLLSHEGLQLLRHRDGEIGVSFDKKSIRYFFILNSPTKIFKLNFEQLEGNTKLEFYQDKGILSFADESGKVILVISSPLILSGDKTSTSLVTWDGAISVPIPADTKFPAVITFGVSATAPEPDAGIEAFFPDLKIGAEGVIDDEDEDAELEDEDEDYPTEISVSAPQEKHTPSETGLELGKFGFSSRYPSFKLDAPWLKALYGDRSLPLSHVPQGQASIFFHPSLGNLKVALNYHGEVTFQDVDWKLSVSVPSPLINDATLIEREGLQVLRSESGELGLSFDKKGARFFVILGIPSATPTLSLHFKIDSGTKVIHERGAVVFQDKAGKPKLVFSSPIGHIASNQNFTFPIEWDSSSHVINVALPRPDSVPFAFAFALHATPPPEDKKAGGKWGLGSALSAVASALGQHPEGWEPAVEVDAPLYEYPKGSGPAASPVSSPSLNPSTTRGAPSSPSTSHAAPHPNTPAASLDPTISGRAAPSATPPSTPTSYGTAAHPNEPTAQSVGPSPGTKTGPTSAPTSHIGAAIPTTTPSLASETTPLLPHPASSSAKTGPTSAPTSHTGTATQSTPSHPASPSSAHKAGPTSGSKSGPTEAHLGPSLDTVGTFGVASPSDFEPVKVAAKVGMVQQDAIDVDVDTPLRKSATVSIKVDSSSSSSSSSSSEGEDDEQRKERKEKGIKRKEKKQGEKDKATEQTKDATKHGSVGNIKPEQKEAEKHKPDSEKDKADKAKAEKDKAEQHETEKHKAEKDKADKDKAEKEKHEAEKHKADKEKANKEKADKEKADKDKADKDKADKDKADKVAKDHAEREKLEKDRTEKEKADKLAKDHAEREKLEKDKAEKDKADKEKADKDKAAKDHAEREKLEKDKAEKEKNDKAAKDHAEREKLEKDKADKDKAAKDHAEREKLEKDKVEKDKADKEKADKEKHEAEKHKADKDKADKDKADKDKADKDKADKVAKDHAEREKLEKDKTEKEKADKDKAEKDKIAKDHAERERADKEKIEKEHDKAEKEREKAAKDKEQSDKEEHEKVQKEKSHKEKDTDKEKHQTEEEREKDKKKAEKGTKGKEGDQAKTAKPKGTKESTEKDKAERERRAKDLAKLGPLPSASFNRGFRRALYENADIDNFVHEAPATTLYSATTNLTFELTAIDGVLSIGPAQGNAWHVRVVPIGLKWHSESARLFKGSAFVAARSAGLEIGAQVREDSSSQFFVLAHGGPLVLRFETSGIGAVKYDEKDGETLFSDTNGKALFIYSTPALHGRSKSKKIQSRTTWDNHNKELRIEAQGYTESLGIVCAICTKCITLPPDDVLYSLPDGAFVVVHPKVNFLGHASAAGISYRSLTPESDPWNITLALQGGKVQKVYAQSKCTVVLLRNDGVREYLAYVDRGGEYVGLHQSFHLHNPPTSYPLRIPIKLSLDGITEIAETADSTITFSTKNGPVFAYGNVVVLDARGNSIASQIRLEDAEADHPKIVIEILEEGEFPLVIG